MGGSDAHQHLLPLVDLVANLSARYCNFKFATTSVNMNANNSHKKTTNAEFSAAMYTYTAERRDVLGCEILRSEGI